MGGPKRRNLEEEASDADADAEAEPRTPPPAPKKRKRPHKLTPDKRKFFSGIDPAEAPSWVTTRMSTKDYLQLCRAWDRDEASKDLKKHYLAVNVPLDTVRFLTNYNQSYFNAKNKLIAEGLLQEDEPESPSISDEVLAEGVLNGDI